VVDYAVRGAAAFRLVPTLRIRLRYAAGGRARALITYGLWSAVIQTGVSVISYTDAVVIGIFMTAAAITPFAFAVSLINYFSEVLVPIAQVFFPVFTKFDALSDAESIKRVYLQASRLMLLLSVSAGLVAWWCAPSFLALWIGPSILSENPWGSAATLFRILVVGAVAIAWQRIGCQVLMGTRRVRLQATLFMAEAACNLGLSVALIQPWGLTGVALGTTVPALIFNVGVHPYFTCQALKLPLRRYLATVLPRPGLAALVSGSVLFWFGHNLPSAVTWLELVSRATGAVALVLGVSLAVGMRSDERENIVTAPIRALLPGVRR
jgi:O-antigen/teichoic acid export membrane protein